MLQAFFPRDEEKRTAPKYCWNAFESQGWPLQSVARRVVRDLGQGLLDWTPRTKSSTSGF
jgi:hypothetical protein